MAFEYSTQGATLDFPNPYRIENQFLAARGLLLLACGVALLLQARGSGAAVQVAHPDLTQGVLLLLIAGGGLLVLLGIVEFGQAALQLRVFFGRGQPASLASDVAREAEGTSAGAQHLVDQLRQGAIALAVPQGALNGVLYSLSRHLVTAPRPLREFMQVRFANALASASLLLLFALTWAFTAPGAARSLVALVYLLLGAGLILRSYLRRASAVVALTPMALAALLVFGIVGSVLVGRAVGGADWPWLAHLALPRIAFVLLAASVVIEALGLYAGHAHVDEPPPASTANDQVAVSFNADPNLLLQEIDRELQRRWNQGIPNRRYIWQPPKVEPTREAGNFTAMALEETQPMPPQAVRRMDWSTCLAFPRFLRLAALDALAVAATGAGALLWLMLGRELGAGQAVESWSAGSIGFILIVVGGYGLRVAHQLWGRLDFESTLIWLDLGGSYARAQVGLGAQWSDRVRSERTVVNVESMTLRAWVVRTRSVIFSYREHEVGSRTLVGMSGDIDAARGWTQLVAQFAAAQSMVVVPGAHEDARRLQQLGAANQLAGAETVPQIAARAAMASAAVAPAPAAARACGHCGALLAQAARFCAQCGTAAGGEVDLVL